MSHRPKRTVKFYVEWRRMRSPDWNRVSQPFGSKREAGGREFSLGQNIGQKVKTRIVEVTTSERIL